MTSLMLIPTIISPDNIGNLAGMLVSALPQKDSIGCAEVVVVYNADGDAAMMRSVLDPLAEYFQMTYIASQIRSTSVQRNIGLAYASGRAEYFLLLDDDLVFLDGCFAAIAKRWAASCSDVGAIGFNIVNQPTMQSSLFAFKELFLMGSRKRGAVLRSGFHCAISPVEEDQDVQWLYSGASMWRAEVFNEFLFDEWYRGYGLGEDLDFSYAVAKKYRLSVSKEARVDHLAHNTQTRDNVLMGKKQVVNRAHFVNKHAEFSKVLFAWAMLGQVAENVFRFVRERDRMYAERLRGNWGGILDVISGND
jgi:glycosyltransferase involved in cell wall biosynthesis